MFAAAFPLLLRYKKKKFSLPVDAAGGGGGGGGGGGSGGSGGGGGGGARVQEGQTQKTPKQNKAKQKKKPKEKKSTKEKKLFKCSDCSEAFDKFSECQTHLTNTNHMDQVHGQQSRCQAAGAVHADPGTADALSKALHAYISKECPGPEGMFVTPGQGQPARFYDADDGYRSFLLLAGGSIKWFALEYPSKFRFVDDADYAKRRIVIAAPGAV